ncbi:MAG: hypothetical protein HYR66_02970 [Sphingobacteriales bacterium]|nr:hypothetical protein [Sphingobacteriales bacterium]MBI3718972.1 hypothetical protein [Sphingobacteriales bacterium]
MKKQIIFRITAITLFACITNLLMAQQTDSKNLPDVKVTSTIVKMNERVWNTFQDEFRGATNVTWYKVDKDYLIKFVMNDIAQKVLYNKNGQQIYHISYFEEHEVPVTISTRLKNQFKGFSIKLALMVEENERVIWVINMENEEKLLFIRIEDGEVELVKELGNAKE